MLYIVYILCLLYLVHIVQYSLDMNETRAKAMGALLRAEYEELEDEAKPLRERLDWIEGCKSNIYFMAESLDCAWRDEAQEADSNSLRDIEEGPGIGMTASIRKVLKDHADEELSPMRVRSLLIENGFSLEGRTNAMPEIHLALKRIAGGRTSRVTRRETERGALYKYSARSAKPNKGI
jgi:hypothetical protein